MLSLVVLWWWSLLVVCWLVCCGLVSGEGVILENGRIYTMSNGGMPWAEAIAIDDETGLIVAVGNNANVRATANTRFANPRTIDLGGRFAMPGFQDAHLHAVEAGINELICPVDDNAPLTDIPFYFDSCPNEGLFADQGWILGAGIDLSVVIETLNADPDIDYPITILDREFPNTPVLILDNVGHGALANTRALSMVGYDLLQGDPPGGRVLRDPQTGALIGIVTESGQQRLREAAFPPTPANQQVAYDALLRSLERLRRHGITSVSDAGGFWRQAQTEAWHRAEREGLLTVRASNALYIYPSVPMEQQLPSLLARYSNNRSSMLRFNQAKIYVDGILSLATSAVYEPYEPNLLLGQNDPLGFEYFGTNLTSVSQTLVDNGFQLHFHVTGDRGAGLALDAIANLTNTDSTLRHRVTHLFMVDPRDWPRFAQLNVVADFQLAPNTLGDSFSDPLVPFLGEERAYDMMPALEIYQTGALLTISSDWDADLLPPLQKIPPVLMPRANGNPLPNLETVLPMVTRNPAMLLQTNTGSLEVGKLGDLIVLDRNIFEIGVADIATTTVLLTMLGGNVIFDPMGIAGAPIGTTEPPTPAPTPQPETSSNNKPLWSTTIMFVMMLVVVALA